MIGTSLASARRVVVVTVMALSLGGCVEPDMRPLGSSASGSGSVSGAATRSPSSAAARRARRANAVDEEVIKAFALLDRCGYQAGRLDHRCDELKQLRALLRKRQSMRGRHGELTRALAQLLGSEKEVERLVAADSVFFYHRKPPVVAALWKALAVEKSATVEATLLRQLCWRREPRVEAAARTRLLDHKKDTVVRAEAANCLGRQRRVDKASKQALRRALAGDPVVVVRGNACAALGTLRDKEALAQMVANLEKPGVGWRCATALAQLGGPEAYAALYKALDKAVRSGAPMATQQVSALASFASRPHVKSPRLVALLARIAGATKLSWLARKRAARELGILGAKRALTKLARQYGKAAAAKGNEALVAKAVQSALEDAAARAKSRTRKRRRRR